MDAQETILKSRAFNPRVIGPSDTVEFTYPHSVVTGLEDPAENIREFTTIGGAKRKQAETDKYRFTVQWFEPTNNVPERLYTMRAGGGDRTVAVTYVHPWSVPGRADYDAESGAQIDGYIADLKFRRVGDGPGGVQRYKCSITIQEK